MSKYTITLTDSQEKVLQYLVEQDPKKPTKDAKLQEIVDDIISDQLNNIYETEKVSQIQKDAEVSVKSEQEKDFEQKVSILENDNLL